MEISFHRQVMNVLGEDYRFHTISHQPSSTSIGSIYRYTDMHDESDKFEDFVGYLNSVTRTVESKDENLLKLLEEKIPGIRTILI